MTTHPEQVASSGDLGSPWVRLERSGYTAWCTIDRPDARNALTPEMYTAISRALDIAPAIPDVRALVITGTDDVFVTGGDVAVDHSRSAPAEMPFHRLRHSPIPVVAAINGFCQASGVLMALLADLAIASDRATFRIPELHAGFPDTWMAAVLPAHVGLTCARELTLTARRVDALEAVRIGLVARVAPHAELSAAVATATAELLRAGPDARIAWRTAADAHYGTIDEHTFDHGAATEEAIEGFRALAGRRRPTWVPRDGARV